MHKYIYINVSDFAILITIDVTKTQCKHNEDATARSLEDETRNSYRNAKRNPNRNHKTIVLGLFSFENLKRDLKR